MDFKERQEYSLWILHFSIHDSASGQGFKNKRAHDACGPFVLYMSSIKVVVRYMISFNLLTTVSISSLVLSLLKEKRTVT